MIVSSIFAVMITTRTAMVPINTRMIRIIQASEIHQGFECHLQEELDHIDVLNTNRIFETFKLANLQINCNIS